MAARELTLYDNPFSPFARKVRLVLAHKKLPFRSVDALALANLDALGAVNPRREVPVLVDGDVVVANSADIVAYLEDVHPEPRIFPTTPAGRVAARAWERLADGVLDAILHDVSIWTWPTHRRQDAPPEGLVDAAVRDVGAVLDRMASALADREFLCGELSIADVAVFPHVSSLKLLGLAPASGMPPEVLAWIERLRAMPIVRQDLDGIKRAAREKFVDGPSPYEGERIVWRGDRIEWLFHHGLVDWWYDEYRAGRAVVPSDLDDDGLR